MTTFIARQTVITASWLNTVDQVVSEIRTRVPVATTLSGDGVTTQFTLPTAPGTMENMDVSVDGLTMAPTDDYTLNDTIITFVVAPPLGTRNILVRYGAPLSSGAPISLANIQAVTRANHSTGGASDEASYSFVRRATYSGGTVGFVNAALRADTYVESAIGSETSAATAYEWAIVGVVHNYATAGQNVGGYFQGRKYSGAGPTWGGVIEVIDYGSPNPATGAVALEVDISANGTDAAGNRVGIDLAVRKQDTGGSACQAGWGFRIQGETGSLVDRGFSYTTGSTVNKAFDCSLATVTQAALTMAQGQPICFNASLDRKLFHDGSKYAFTDINNVSLWELKDNYSLVANGVQLLGTRRTGWTAATGTASRSTFDTATVTTEELAKRVKALVDDLTLHGLIGA